MPFPSHQDPAPPRPLRKTTTGAASAPYNFVPLPERVVPAAAAPEALPGHDRYGTGDDAYRHTGHFEVTLETKSPLYVRSSFTLQEFREGGAPRADERKPFRERVKNKAAFFHTRQPKGDAVPVPVIPGSSLRGMLRSLVEIVSHGAMDARRMSGEPLFYRALDLRDFRNVFSGRSGPRVKAGFLRRTSRGEYEVVPCDFARVPRALIGGGALYDADGYPVWHGPWHQHQPVWVTLRRNAENKWSPTRDRVEGIHPSRRGSEYAEGRLVITGDIEGRKQKEYVFLVPPADATALPVPSAVLDLLHHANQLTDYQQGAYPTDEPHAGAREQAGYVEKRPAAPGEPVFFLQGQQEGRTVVRLLGRNPAFRLPAGASHTPPGTARSPLDFVPEALRRPEGVDFADALFGFIRTGDGVTALRRRWISERVRQGGDLNDAEQAWEQEQAPRYRQGRKARAYAGRVTVSDARLDKGQAPQRVYAAPLVPKILSAPKPTCFPHYLVQHASKEERFHKGDLKHYDSPTPDSDGPDAEKTTIRGYKRYWPQGSLMERGQVTQRVQPQAGEPDVDEHGTVHEYSQQYTQMQPVKPGTAFTFSVHFENLSAVELGALCWALRPRGEQKTDYVHQLGMGKPLGFGAVALDATLHLGDRRARYSTLFDDGAWATGVPSALAPTIETLSQDFERHVLEQLEASDAEHLRDLDRIRDLLTLMQWPGAPAVWGTTSRDGTPSAPVYLKEDDRVNTRYMALDEFRKRHVLPTPRGVLHPPGHARRQDHRGQQARRKRTQHDQRRSSQPSPSALADRLSPEQREKLESMSGSTSASDVQRGQVKWFNTDKGYGFIKPEQGGKDVFVHITNLQDGYVPKDGHCVEYEVERTPKGLGAFNVRPC